MYKSVTIILAILLLKGCWGLTFEGDRPKDYTDKKRKIESLYGATQEEITNSFGDPEWIEKKGESTFHIYDWHKSDIGVAFFVIPIPIAGGRTKTSYYCILLEFDSDDRLIRHASRSDSHEGAPDDDFPCKRLFGMQGYPYPQHYIDCEGTYSEIKKCAENNYKKSSPYDDYPSAFDTYR